MAFDESLVSRLSSLHFRNSDEDKRYLAAYPLLLDYFKNHIAIERPTASNAKIAVILVYTWMAPAKLNPSCLDRWGKASIALKGLLTDSVTAQGISDLQQFVGGSLIATSKFLHFAKPDAFAIWDRRVAGAGYRYRWPYEYNQIERYLTYLNDLKELIVSDQTVNLATEVVGDVTPMRLKEFALFQLGVSEQTEN